MFFSPFPQFTFHRTTGAPRICAVSRRPSWRSTVARTLASKCSTIRSSRRTPSRRATTAMCPARTPARRRRFWTGMCLWLCLARCNIQLHSCVLPAKFSGSFGAWRARNITSHKSYVRAACGGMARLAHAVRGVTQSNILLRVAYVLYMVYNYAGICRYAGVHYDKIMFVCVLGILLALFVCDSL